MLIQLLPPLATHIEDNTADTMSLILRMIIDTLLADYFIIAG